MTAAERALEFIANDTVVGLGSGRASTSFIHAVGERVKGGLRIRGVPTSQATADLATQLGIPLVRLDEIEHIDVAVDGADEVDPRLDLIKGYGGALVREMIVAASAKKFVVLVGREKLVPTLGSRGILPVEVVPFGQALCHRRLVALGCRPKPRLVDGATFVTDNGNHILDCGIGTLSDPLALAGQILSIPGVVGTGLFVQMADVVVVEDGQGVEVVERERR
jgi:ribose 5-phosphate isomerase A